MKNKIALFVSFLAGILLLASCLKDKVGDYWPSGVAGKMYATVPAFTLNTLALAPISGDQDFSFLVNIAVATPPTQDITLTLAVDTAGVTRYNTLNGTSFLSYPNVQVLTPTVTIKSGTRNDSIRAKVWGADAVNACSNYMTAITITSAKMADGTAVPIANNMQSYYLALPVSNPYAGNYQCVGYRIRVGVDYPVNQVEAATTVNCSTVQFPTFGDYPYYLNVQITQNIMVVGGVNCFACNVTVIDPGTGAPVASGEGQYATYTGDPTETPIPVTNDVNYYNPVTKTFVLNAYYNSATPRIAYEVLTRK